jgi:uncharacterized cupredoxin-like copper-binding protein
MRPIDRAVLAALMLVAVSGEARSTAPQSGTEPAPSKQMDFGIAGDTAGNARTVDLEARDHARLAPSRIAVKEGETIRFAIRNTGTQVREISIGTMKDLKHHADMQAAGSSQAYLPYVVRVAPGSTEELLWTFNRRGTFYLASLASGRLEHGMVGKIVVIAR